MKKTSFNITTGNGQETRTGYIFDYNGLSFGIDCRKSLINSDKRWHVTELSTGLSVFKDLCRTRKQAIGLIKRHIIKIKSAAQDKVQYTLCRGCGTPFNHTTSKYRWVCSDKCF